MKTHGNELGSAPGRVSPNVAVLSRAPAAARDPPPPSPESPRLRPRHRRSRPHLRLRQVRLGRGSASTSAAGPPRPCFRHVRFILASSRPAAPPARPAHPPAQGAVREPGSTISASCHGGACAVIAGCWQESC